MLRHFFVEGVGVAPAVLKAYRGVGKSGPLKASLTKIEKENGVNHISAAVFSSNIPLTRLDVAAGTVQSVIEALNEGRISEAVGQFADQFLLTDHALGLEFTEKERLIDFFRTSREVFPNTVVRVVSIFHSEDAVVTEWELTASHNESNGNMPYRVPISFSGVSIVHVRDGRIVRWSDFYDQLTSRRFSMASLFKDWIEY